MPFELIAEIITLQVSSPNPASAAACADDLQQATRSLNEARFVALAIASYALVAMVSIITALRILR